ncbi:unnamed protein product, partial [Staurois parvus]
MSCQSAPGGNVKTAAGILGDVLDHILPRTPTRDLSFSGSGVA